jgi:hypothetical protein
MTQEVTSRTSNLRLFAIAIAGLTVLAVLTVLVKPAPPMPPLTVRSAEPDGAMALSLWLEGSGYEVRQVLSDPVRLDEIDVLFVLDPFLPYSEQDVNRIHDWVARGNRLIVAGDPYNLRDLLEPFGVGMTYLTDSEALVSSAAPTLLSPPVDTARVEAIYGIESARDDLLIHLSSDGEPVLVSFTEGEGTVWVSGALRPFTNRGLHDPMSARIVVNLLRGAHYGAAVGFDEARHGFSETPRSLYEWLLSSPPGWGILSSLGLVVAFIALRGRRFGRTVPIPQARLRREPVEYIQAMANLFRRSGQRSEILKHYSGQLRRRLSERYALEPRLDNVELVRTLVFRDPTIDEAALRGLLDRLSKPQVSEQELITIVGDVDDWLRKIH